MFCLDSYESLHAHRMKEGAHALYKVIPIPNSHSLLNATPIAMQMIVVFIQNRKKPLRMLGELLIVLTGLKPGFDAARVCSGKEMDEYQSVDAKTELVVAKCAEMVFESIPGCILQMFAILKSGDRSHSALVSVAVSALTTGFNSATISFDFDVDPRRRKEAPEFYGYIPDDGKRTVIFVCMVINSSLLLLIRSLSAVMLMLVKRRYFLLYMAGDMALYLLLKVARLDFHYWMPIDGLLGLLVSLLVRVIVKTITDFTGVVQFRHPYELGGLYWTCSMALALLASFVSVWVYFEYGSYVVTQREAWTLVGCMGGAWVITFVLFLLLMKKKYRSSFFSTTSGRRNSMNYFLLGENDEVKSAVLGCKKQHWSGIREEVKEWCLDNWYLWVDEKPTWFSEAWIVKIPKDFIPDDIDEGMLSEIIYSGRYSRQVNSYRGSGASVHPVV